MAIEVRLLAVSSLLFFMGCAGPGLIYTSITQPITLNMSETPRGVKQGSLSTHGVKIPLGRSDLSAEWSSRAIGDAAKRSGLTEVYYADLEIFSILNGLYLERSIIVYGQ